MKNLSSIIVILSLIVVATNVALFDSKILGVASIIFFLGSTGYLFGGLFWRDRDKLIRSALGALVGIALVMILGSGFYYLFRLDKFSTIAIVFIITVLAVVCGWLTRHKNKNIEVSDLHKTNIIWKSVTLIAFIIFISLAFKTLFAGATFDSIRSPWEVLSTQFFIFAFLAATSLIILALQKTKLALLAAIIFFFLFFSITNFIYPLGYGFDPFIHQATETYISEHGTITPKPFFYIGQYALVNTLRDITNLSITSIDRFLLPIILSVFLPLAGWIAFHNYLTIALLPLLPITTFASTTPQGIANAFIFFILLIAFGTRQDGRLTLIPLWILGFAAVLTHPISGIPAIIFLILWSILPELKTKEIQSPNFSNSRVRVKTRYIFATVIALAGALILPMLFFIYGLIQGSQNIIKQNFLSSLTGIFSSLLNSLAGSESRFNFIIDFVYFYRMNLTLVILIGAFLALTILFIKKERRVLAYPLTAISLLVGAIIMLDVIDFSFLPAYEQTGYVERLFDLARIFIYVPFLFGASWGIKIAFEKNYNFACVALISLIAGFLTSSLYLTYPHNDVYTTERGWSVSRADIEAVNFIDNDARDKNFIALANQSVSAAALSEFGFKKYFNLKTDGKEETVFYYPIPTGGPLYDYFLRMSYNEPRRGTIHEAAELTGVNLGYFVVNRYWWKSEELIERAKREADSWQEFGSGKVFVFKFENL